jgi:hypothetical protein
MSGSNDINSVQGFTYQKIANDYDIVFNDDGAGEIADLVAIRDKPDHIQVDLFHCKYCGSGQNPGARVDDAYVVSGQASRSVKWLHKGPALFERLLKRYDHSHQKGFNRLLKGLPEQIDKLQQKARLVEVRMGFVIVQPAFSQQAMSDEIKAVLGTSYMYIKNIASVELKVICSP